MIILQVSVTIILLTATIHAYKHPETIEVDLASLSSDYIQYDGNQWAVYDGQIQNANATLFYGPYMHIDAGSYTIYIEYFAEKLQTFQLASNKKGALLHANDFNLSRNKRSVAYDFYVTQDIDDLELKLINYNGGYVSISNIELRKNNHNVRIMLFLWIVFSIILDLFLFCNISKNNCRKIKIIIGIALIPSIVLLMRGVNLGHDWGFHFARIESIAMGLKNGEFPVKMCQAFNDGYGYPVSIFYGDILLLNFPNRYFQTKPV